MKPEVFLLIVTKTKRQDLDTLRGGLIDFYTVVYSQMKELDLMQALW